MNSHIPMLVFAIACTVSFASISDYETQSTDNEVMKNKKDFKGDILDDKSEDPDVVQSSERKWPNGIVPYVIDSKLKKSEPLIKSAMKDIENRTLIKFMKRKNEQHYISFIPGKGHYSRIGRRCSTHPLSLDSKCSKFGIIVHELMHAVGFVHEHPRTDRDEFLNVHYNNILPEPEVLCPPILETDVFSVQFSNGRKINSTANFSCKDANLKIVGGSDTRTCQHPGEWSGANPDCEDKTEPMQDPNLFEGDILGYSYDRHVPAKSRLWPNGFIPYTIDPKLKSQEPLIRKAMQYYADKTCIRFVPRTDERHYVQIFPGRGCFSHVGNTFSVQSLSLGPRCFKFGTLLHELGHTVGFFHEHSRVDRDNYLNIHYNNVQKGMESQFMKFPPYQNKLLTPFDFDSVMLYGETMFSKNVYNGLKTMTAKNGRKLQDVTEKTGLSDDDIERINKLYQC